MDVAINLGGSAFLVAVFPDYTERMMATVRSDVVDSFAYGIGALLLPVILVVAAVLNGALTFTGLGAILSLCIGATGFGAALRDKLP